MWLLVLIGLSFPLRTFSAVIFFFHFFQLAVGGNEGLGVAGGFFSLPNFLCFKLADEPFWELFFESLKIGYFVFRDIEIPDPPGLGWTTMALAMLSAHCCLEH